MATATLISIEEYLETSYRPDCEFIDGEVVERNMGKWEHSRVQILLGAWFVQNESIWKVQGATEWRTRVSGTRVRIPDLVLVAAGPQDPVLAHPPILIVEILSPADTYTDTESRARDYQRMGVETIWIVDPQTRTGRVCTGATWTQATRLEVPRTLIHVDLTTLFAALDPVDAMSDPTGKIVVWTSSPHSLESSRKTPATPSPATASRWNWSRSRASKTG